MDSSQSNSGRSKQTDDKAATSMDSSQPNRSRGRPKQTDDDSAKSRTLTLQKKKEHEAAKRSAQKAEGGAAYEHVIVSCVAQCAALYNSAVESIHVADKSGHECQNLSIEHGFIAIKQWPV